MELMSEGQWKRWEVVGRLRAGKLTMVQAALVLALSGRQVRRLRDRVATEGRRALRHRNTGRVPVHALGAGVRMRIVRLRREKYRDFNDAHFAEKLATETPPLRVSVATVRVSGLTRRLRYRKNSGERGHGAAVRRGERTRL